jgi:hypothetical protein
MNINNNIMLNIKKLRDSADIAFDDNLINSNTYSQLLIDLSAFDTCKELDADEHVLKADHSTKFLNKLKRKDRSIKVDELIKLEQAKNESIVNKVIVNGCVVLDEIKNKVVNGCVVLDEIKNKVVFVTALIIVAPIYVPYKVGKKVGNKVVSIVNDANMTITNTISDMYNEVKEKFREYPETDICCICRTEKSRVAFFPCKHMCTCKICSDRVNNCPLCVAKIDEKISLFIS